MLVSCSSFIKLFTLMESKQDSTLYIVPSSPPPSAAMVPISTSVFQHDGKKVLHYVKKLEKFPYLGVWLQPA